MSSALRTRRYAGSNPVRKANHQRVGESGRPYLPWKQGIVCSNHTTLTIVIDPWRNRNAAVCKTVMSRGSTGRVIQDKQIAGLRKEIAELFHVLVDQMDSQRISTPPCASSSPVERTNISTRLCRRSLFLCSHSDVANSFPQRARHGFGFQVGDVHTSPFAGLGHRLITWLPTRQSRFESGSPRHICTLRLSARLSVFHGEGASSILAGCAILGGFVQWHDGAF
jgi:hypothetical protein